MLSAFPCFSVQLRSRLDSPAMPAPFVGCPQIISLLIEFVIAALATVEDIHPIPPESVDATCLGATPNRQAVFFVSPDLLRVNMQLMNAAAGNVVFQFLFSCQWPVESDVDAVRHTCSVSMAILIIIANVCPKCIPFRRATGAKLHVYVFFQLIIEEISLHMNLTNLLVRVYPCYQLQQLEWLPLGVLALVVKPRSQGQARRSIRM